MKLSVLMLLLGICFSARGEVLSYKFNIKGTLMKGGDKAPCVYTSLGPPAIAISKDIEFKVVPQYKLWLAADHFKFQFNGANYELVAAVRTTEAGPVYKEESFMGVDLYRDGQLLIRGGSSNRIFQDFTRSFSFSIPFANATTEACPPHLSFIVDGKVN